MHQTTGRHRCFGHAPTILWTALLLQPATPRTPGAPQRTRRACMTSAWPGTRSSWSWREWRLLPHERPPLSPHPAPRISASLHTSSQLAPPPSPSPSQTHHGVQREAQGQSGCVPPSPHQAHRPAAGGASPVGAGRAHSRPQLPRPRGLHAAGEVRRPTEQAVGRRAGLPMSTSGRPAHTPWSHAAASCIPGPRLVTGACTPALQGQ